MKKILSLTVTAALIASATSFNVMAETTSKTAEQTTGRVLYQSDFEDGTMTGLGTIYRPNMNPVAKVSVVNVGTEEAPQYKLKATTGGVAHAYIKDSAEWTDFRFEGDVSFDSIDSTTYPRIFFRAPAVDDWQQFQGNYPYVGYQFASQAGLGVYCGGALKSTSPAGKDPWWTATGKTLHVNLTVNGDDVTLVTTGDNDYSTTYTSTIAEGYDKGYLAFGNIWGANGMYVYWDDITVTDLSATASIDKETDIEAGDEVAITFSEAMDLTDIADKVVLSDGTTQTALAVTARGDDTIVATIPDDILPGAGYTLKVLKTIKDADGSQMNEDREFKITTKAETQGILYYNDFSENYEGLSIIHNSAAAGTENTIAVADGKLNMTVGGNFTNFIEVFIDGSEDWQEYRVEANTSIPTKPGYFRIYTHSDGTAQNGVTHYFYHDGSKLKTEGGVEVTGAHHTSNRITIVVDEETATEYIVPTYQWETNNTLIGSEVATKTSEVNYGGVGFEVIYKNNILFDEIKVIDLRATAEAENTENLLPGDVVTVKFSENMDVTTLTSENVVWENAGDEIPVAVSNNGANELYVTVPDEILSNETYTLTVKKEVKDASGDRLNNDKVFEVKTKKSEFNVVSVYPENGAKNVSILDDIQIEFDNPVDYSAENSVVSLTDENGNAVSCEISQAHSTDKKMYILTDDTLLPGVTYILKISGVTSLSGEKMLGTKTVTFKTAEEAASYLYYNDFETDSLDEFEISKGTGNETVEIKDGRLYLTMSSQSAIVSGDEAYAKIIGSEDWSDYEVEADVQANNAVAYPVLRTRGESLPTSISIVNSKYDITTDGNKVSKTVDGGHAFGVNKSRKLVVRVVGNKFTVSLDDEVIFDGIESANAAKVGGVELGSIYMGTVSFGEIKVKDLGISYTVNKVKNITEGEEVLVTFDRAMNKDTFDSLNVMVTDAEGIKLNTSVRAVDDTTMAIKIPYGVESNEIYKVWMSKDISSAEGVLLSSDKEFSIKTVEKDLHIGNMILKNSSGEVSKLSAGDVVKASAIAKNNMATSQGVVVVMAIYENNKLIEVKTAEELLPSKSEKTLETEGYTVPATEGITVRVMAVDDLDTIMPLAQSKLYTK